MDLQKIEDICEEYKKAVAREKALRDAIYRTTPDNPYQQHFSTRLHCQQGTSMDHYVRIEIPHAAALPFMEAELRRAEQHEAELRIKLHAMNQILGAA